MKLFEQIDRVNRLHELIKHRRTGTPQQLAKRLKLSAAMVYKIIGELKEMDVPIEYSRQLKTYYYSEPYLMNIKPDFRPVGVDEITGAVI